MGDKAVWQCYRGQVEGAWRQGLSLADRLFRTGEYTGS